MYNNNVVFVRQENQSVGKRAISLGSFGNKWINNE